MDSRLFYLIFVVFLGLILYAFWKDRQAKAALRERGVTITAQVIARDHKSSINQNSDGTTTHDDTYYIEYGYTVNGSSYSRKDIVGYGRYNAVREGQPVEIVYLPENPKEARLASLL
jgi:hypothetical protein